MNFRLVNYSVRPKTTGENIHLIEEFFRELQEKNITGIEYTVYRIGQTSFIHVSGISNEEAGQQVASLPAFRHFLETMNDRLDQDPISNEIKEIGRYPEA